MSREAALAAALRESSADAHMFGLPQFHGFVGQADIDNGPIEACTDPGCVEAARLLSETAPEPSHEPGCALAPHPDDPEPSNAHPGRTCAEYTADQETDAEVDAFVALMTDDRAPSQDRADGRALRRLREALPKGASYTLWPPESDASGFEVEVAVGHYGDGVIAHAIRPTIEEAADAARLALGGKGQRHDWDPKAAGRDCSCGWLADPLARGSQHAQQLAHAKALGGAP